MAQQDRREIPQPNAGQVSRRTFLRRTLGLAGAGALAVAATAVEPLGRSFIDSKGGVLAAEAKPVAAPFVRQVDGGLPAPAEPEVPLVGPANEVKPNDEGASAQVIGEPGKPGEAKANPTKPIIEVVKAPEIREAPKVSELNIRPLPGTERLRLSQLTKAQQYLQGTVDVMYSTGNPILIGYVDILFTRFRAEEFVDVPGVDQQKVQTFLYFHLVNRPPILKLPYAPVADDIVDSSGNSIIVPAFYMAEGPMADYPSNSEDSIFALVYTLDHNKARAITFNKALESKTPAEIVRDTRNPGSNINETTYAINQMMRVYDQSHQDLADIGILLSTSLENLYREWKPIDEMSPSLEKDSALRDFIVRRYYKSS